MPPIVTSPDAVTIRWIVISLRVSVPVLSEPITDAEPSVSTDDSFLTIACRRAIRWTPRARITDRIAGSPSGTAATASDTPINRTSMRSVGARISEVARIAAMTMTAMPMTAMPSVRPTRSISRWSGVRSFVVAASSVAIRPISVPMPVAVTTARPRPRETAVPLNTMFTRSPSCAGPGSGPAPLRTGSLSPVSEDSPTVIDAACSRRASALTASPSARTRMSPGTTSWAGIVTSRPSRTTWALGAAMRASAATARSALRSCA